MREHDLIRLRAARAVQEIREVLDTVDPAAVAALLAAFGRARRVFFAAQGRSGLVARAVAMRCMHLGLTAYVAGETVTPPIGEGDLLVCLSASGQTATTLGHAAAARTAGAGVAALTAQPAGALAATADLVVVVPARIRVATAQHAGSLFEQSCLVLGDVLCGAYQELTAVPERDLDQRHANLL